MPNFQVIQDVPKSLPLAHRQALRELFGDGPTGTDPEHTNRCTGEVLVLLTETLGYTAAQAVGGLMIVGGAHAMETQAFRNRRVRSL